MLLLIFCHVGNGKVDAKLCVYFFRHLRQLVCLLWHDVLNNRIPDCLQYSLGPVECFENPS